MDHVLETLIHRSGRSARHGCFVSETSRVQESAFIDSWLNSVKVFKGLSHGLVAWQGFWVAQASCVLASTSRDCGLFHRLPNPHGCGISREDRFGATPKIRAGLASIRETRALPKNSTRRRRARPGKGRGRGVTLGVAVGDGVAVGLGVPLGVGVGVGVGVGIPPGVTKA